MKKKDYDKLIRKFNRYPARKKVPILFDALEEMQSYNGRSVSDCIVLAMGGSYADEESEEK